MNTHKIVTILLGAIVLAAGASTWLAGCRPPEPGNGGITFTLLGGIITLTFFDIGPIETRANETVSVPTAVRLFDETPPETPPSGQMTLPSTSVGVASRLTAKTIAYSQSLPLNGFATIRFKIAAGQSAELCASAVLLAEYEMDLTFGVASIRNQVFDLSQEAIRVMMANDVTICIEITADFDGEITIGEYFYSFGGGAGGNQPPSAIAGPPILPGGLTQVPIDSLGGRGVVAPVNRTISGIVYGVVGVLDATTPAVTPPAVDPGTISVVPAEIGLLTVETLYLGTHSSFVPDVDDGVVLATLTVIYTDAGLPTTLAFVTGSTTAEWSYDRPEHTSALGGVQHAQAPVLYSFETTIGSAFTYDGFSYSVALPVDSFRTISSLTLSVTDPATYAPSRLETGSLAGWAGQAITAITMAGQALVIAQEEACCFDDGSCADLERDDCIAVLGTPQGEGTDCATTDCPSEGEEPEACCFDDGSCADLERDDCIAVLGTPQGEGTDCATADCPGEGEEPEACCFDDGQCTDTDPETCVADGGAPDGPGSECLSSCLGACCKPDGNCEQMTLAQCDTANGEYAGWGVDCASATCGALGGCCFDDSLSCFGDISASDCQNTGGTPLPDCEPDTLDPCLFACCLIDGTCTEGLSVDDCNADGGTVSARGTKCADVTCAPAAPTKWVLMETLVNPTNADSTFINTGRFEGSFVIWSETPNSLTLENREVDNGFESYNVTVTATFPTPPSELIPGETVTLSVSFTGTGTVINFNPGIQFQYWVDDNPIDPSVAYQYFPWNPASPDFGNDASTTYNFTVPSVGTGGELEIVAFLWNCSECNVYWVYRPG